MYLDTFPVPYSYKATTHLINDGKTHICTPHKVVSFKKTSTIKPELTAKWKPVTNIQPKAIYQPPPADLTVPHRQARKTPNQPLPPLTPTQSKSHKTKSLMTPRNKALRHPAADALLQYATDGCPLDCGQDWTLAQMEAAIQKGPIRVHNYQKPAKPYAQKHSKELQKVVAAW